MSLTKSQSDKRIIILLAAVFINLILFLSKLYVAISSNSISIYVDSLNSLADTLVCVIAIIGFRISAMKPNNNFPFGLGRVEELVSFILSAIIFITGAAFVYTSLERLMYPVPVWFASKYAFVIGTTAAVKLFMALFFRKAYKKYHSPVIKNLGVDSVLDFFISACIVISFTLTAYIGYSVDSIMGIIVSIVIIISGLKSLIESGCALIGRQNSAECQSVAQLIKSNDNVIDVDSVCCHNYGDNKVFTANVFAECDTAEQLVELNEQLKQDIKQQFFSELYISFGR